MVIGENGIFSKARNAKVETEKSQYLEELRVKALEVQADKDGKATTQDFLEKLGKEDYEYLVKNSPIATIKSGSDTIIGNPEMIYLEYKGYYFKVTNKLEVYFQDEIIEEYKFDVTNIEKIQDKITTYDNSYDVEYYKQLQNTAITKDTFTSSTKISKIKEDEVVSYTVVENNFTELDYTWLKLTTVVIAKEDFSINMTATADDNENIYLNNEHIGGTTGAGPSSFTATYNFREGANILEIYLNEGYGGCYAKFDKLFNPQENIIGILSLSSFLNQIYPNQTTKPTVSIQGENITKNIIAESNIPIKEIKVITQSEDEYIYPNTNIQFDETQFNKSIKIDDDTNEIIAIDWLGNYKINLIESKIRALIPVLDSTSTKSFCSSNYGGCESYKAFDNIDSTYWCSAGGAETNAYVGYDFTDKVKVDFITLYNGNLSYGTNERCKDVVLQCSNNKDDQSSWIDASDITTLIDDNRTLCTIENTKVTESYQYWRLFIKTSYGGYSSTYKMQFYENQ